MSGLVTVSQSFIQPECHSRHKKCHFAGAAAASAFFVINCISGVCGSLLLLGEMVALNQERDREWAI